MREHLPSQTSILQLVKGANRYKITQLCREMWPRRKPQACHRSGSIYLISYCCQGLQNGPRSPQSLSPNCDKGYSLKVDCGNLFLHVYESFLIGKRSPVCHSLPISCVSDSKEICVLEWRLLVEALFQNSV